MKLFETYNIKVTKIRKKDGTLTNYAYIDPKTSTDNTMAIKDDLKKYGAVWNGYDKVWGWYLSPDQDKLQAQLEKLVYPAIEFLNSKETPPEEGPRTAESMKTEFQQLLSEIDNALSSPMGVPEGVTPVMDEATLKQKLKEFKEELVQSMTNEEFLAKLEPIIKFRKAQGHRLSFMNALIIWCQDRNAKLVKARGTWEKYYHRTVKPGAPALVVSVPVTTKQTHYASKQEKEEYRQKFLAKLGKSSEEELTGGEKDQLRVGLLQLNYTPFQSFEYKACYYDIRYTEQMEGYPDEVGGWDKDTEDIPWSDTTSEPTELSIKIYDAMLEIIQETGIKLGFVKDLGGAMGVSKSGSIDVLQDSNKNAGAASTLIHEYAHELLHQQWVKTSKAGSDWAKFFIGKEQGRAVVEQQAEMTAYLVLRFFGVKLQENINYISLWGADANQACRVFDTIANVANRIADELAKKLGVKTLNEDEGRGKMITGMDVAKLLGQDAVNLYNQSKQRQIQMVQENFKSFFERINKQWF